MSDMQAGAIGAADVNAGLSPGRTLASAREARGLTVTEVALRVKFAPRQIEALEADDYDALPGATIVRGMVRSYAKVLGLDPNPLVDDLQRRIVADPFPVNPTDMRVPFQETQKRSTRWYLWLSLLIIVAVLGVLAEWFFRTQLAQQPASTAPAAEAPAPVAPEPVPVAEPQPVVAPVTEPPVEAAAPAPAVPAGLRRLDFEFGRDAWVEVRDGDNKVLLAQTNRAGTPKTIEGKPPFALIIGNAGAVKLKYDGKAVDLAPHTRTDVARLKLE